MGRVIKLCIIVQVNREDDRDHYSRRKPKTQRKNSTLLRYVGAWLRKCIWNIVTGRSVTQGNAGDAVRDDVRQVLVGSVEYQRHYSKCNHKSCEEALEGYKVIQVLFKTSL